ncbi:MAG: class I SAM-dependent methyltransferase [Bacteroidales bacterium]|nr:class I SAM-dependent methyltransferase [Bacteroidales bacterium]
MNCSEISGTMYPLQLLFHFLKYLFRKVGNSCNHPFIIDFQKYVLHGSKHVEAFETISNIRNRLTRQVDLADLHDEGAGSRKRRLQVSLGKKARMVSVPHATGRLLFHLVCHYKPDTIIELGTAMGVSTLYLAMGRPETQVFSVEGNRQLALIAKSVFESLKLNNIKVIINNFEDTLEQLIQHMSGRVLVFIDGNHTREAVLRYYNTFAKNGGANTILVFDDITWSTGMMEAWQTICSLEKKSCKIDLFKAGIVFRNQVPGGCMCYL